MRTTRLSLMPSMQPTLICSGSVWRLLSRRSGLTLIGMSWTFIVMWIPSVLSLTSSLVLWSVHLSGGRSMAWNGSIAWSRSLSVCGADISSVILCSFGTWRKSSKGSKTYPSFLTVKEGSTSHLGLLPSGKKRETALLGARNRYAIRLAGHQSPRPCFAGWDRLGEES